MKNVDRLAKHIAEFGPSGILIHSIPGSQNWIVAQKVEENQWLLTILDPMKTISFTIGSVNNQEHLEIWKELVSLEIDKRSNQIEIARILKHRVHNFISKHNQFKKFIDKKTKKPKKK